MRLYEFEIKVQGWGDSPEDAWEQVQENFYIEEQTMPEKHSIIESDEEE